MNELKFTIPLQTYIIQKQTSTVELRLDLLSKRTISMINWERAQSLSFTVFFDGMINLYFIGNAVHCSGFGDAVKLTQYGNELFSIPETILQMGTGDRECDNPAGRQGHWWWNGQWLPTGMIGFRCEFHHDCCGV